MPQTLADIVSGEQLGCELRLGYHLELQHTCMGCFPAIFKEETKRPVIVFERDLLDAVAKYLTPRKCVVSSGLYFVNTSTMEACSVSGYNLEEKLQNKVFLALNRTEYNRITAGGANPFSWAPGLVGDDMSPEEFRETLRQALKHAAA